MNYLQNIKDIDDFRKANRDAFKMEIVYKFNNDNYIGEYDYDLCGNDSAEEDSQESEGENRKEDSDTQNMEKNTNETENPFCSYTSIGDNNLGPSGKSSLKSHGKLTKSVNDCLDKFSEKFS